MATKISKFKAKTRKGAVKRIRLTKTKIAANAKVIVGRINAAHRMIGKTGERKLRSQRKTTVSKIANKYKRVLS